MKIAMITAGGAGMFCGSCMQDNTLVRSLRLAGADALLLPTYTPIRVDEENVSSHSVFLGGINVYLDSKLPGWKLLPRVLKRWLDRPAVVRFLSKRSSSTNAADLGSLTVDLLQGTAGPQKTEIRELIAYLCNDLQPDVILFSNALLSGVVPALRKQFRGKLWCLLQGDDIFLNALKEPWKTKAMQLLQNNAVHFDGVLTHSHYYADFMGNYLSVPKEKFRTIPLSIEGAGTTTEHLHLPEFTEHNPQSHLTVGYFARICPEKGAWNFLEAAEKILPERPDLKMKMGGYLPELHRSEFEQRSAYLGKHFADRFEYCGSPDSRDEKFQLIHSFDWLCVPTEYHEPKGLYVLEAALSGVPSLLPAHGAFPERIAELTHGRLYDPADPNALTDALRTLSKRDVDTATALRTRCLQYHTMKHTGQQVLVALRSRE